MKKTTLTIMVVLVTILFLGGCAGMAPLSIPKNQTAYFNSGLRDDSNVGVVSKQQTQHLIIIIKDIGQKDFSEIENSLNLSKDVYHGLSQEKIGDNSYLWHRSMITLNYYDSKNSMGYIQVLDAVGTNRGRKVDKAEIISGDERLQLEISKARDLKYIYEISINPLLSFTGYYIESHFEGKNRSINATSSGGTIIEVFLDASTKITVGGLVSATDDKGRFFFDGTVSMSKLTEGIVTITNGKGEKIEATQDENGKWLVQIEGIKTGKPYSAKLLIDSLNN